MHFSQYEESMIMKWLAKTDGYRWIQFEQEGYEDIFYKVMINALPHQVPTDSRMYSPKRHPSNAIDHSY